MLGGRCCWFVVVAAAGIGVGAMSSTFPERWPPDPLPAHFGMYAPRIKAQGRRVRHVNKAEVVPFEVRDRSVPIYNSINFVTGQLGSGKSYYATRMAFSYLAQGKYVALNYDLRGRWYGTAAGMSYTKKGLLKDTPAERYQPLRSMAAHCFRFDEIGDLHEWVLPGDPEQEDRGLLVLDEGALRHNSRSYRENMSKAKARHGDDLADLAFFVNMRKRGWTCLMLAQDLEMLDKQLRMTGVTEIQLRNFARMRLPFIKSTVAKNPKFLAVHYQHQKVSMRVGRDWFGLNKKIANHYKSLALFDRMEDVGSLGMRPMVDWGSLFAMQPVPFERWIELFDAPSDAAPPAA